MRIHFHSPRHLKTAYIVIANRNCKACWKCIEACPNGVIEKIDMLFHKHSHIRKPKDCKGCMKCVKVCEYGAIQAVGKLQKLIF